MKISLNFPETLLEKMDAYCEVNDFERSEFVRSLVRDALDPKSVEKKLEYVQKVSTPIEIPHNNELEAGSTVPFVDMWCQLHFEAKKNYPCVKISYEDENGIEIVHEKWACPKCVESYKNRGVGKVYFL